MTYTGRPGVRPHAAAFRGQGSRGSVVAGRRRQIEPVPGAEFALFDSLERERRPGLQTSGLCIARRKQAEPAPTTSASPDGSTSGSAGSPGNTNPTGAPGNKDSTPDCD